MKTKEQRQEKVINTKISHKAHAQLCAITDRANIKIYTILQCVVDCFIKCFCESEPINDYMREMLSKFVDIDRAKNGFCFCAPLLQNLKMTKCLAIVTKAKKTIPEIVLIQTENGKVTENHNSDKILTEFLQAFSPKILHGLQRIKGNEKMHNLTDALLYAVNEIAYPKDPLHSEIEQMFTDINNAVYYDEDAHAKQTGRKSKKQMENLCASAFELKQYKRQYNRKQDSEPARAEFDPSQIYDPLKDYEPEFVPDIEQAFTPDFDPSEIYDPLKDYEPEFVPDIEPEFVPDYEPQYT